MPSVYNSICASLLSVFAFSALSSSAFSFPTSAPLAAFAAAATVNCPVGNAQINVEIDGGAHEITGCTIDSLMRISFSASNVPANSATRLVIYENDISNSVVIESTLSSTTISEMNSLKASLEIRVERNVAKVNAAKDGTTMQVVFTGAFPENTTITTANNNLAGFFGLRSFAAMKRDATVMDSLESIYDATFSQVGTLKGSTTQLDAVLSLIGIVPPATLMPVISPFVLAEFSLSGSTSSLSLSPATRTSTSEFVVDTDPLAVATSASGSPDPETVAFSYVSVYGAVSVSNGAKLLISNITCRIKPTIDYSKRRNIRLVSAFLLMQTGGAAITVSDGGIFELKGNTFETQIAAGSYTLANGTSSLSAGVFPAVTIRGLDESSLSFIFMAPRSVIESFGSASTSIDIATNTVTIDAALGEDMVLAALRMPAAITIDAYLRRAGFIAAVSGTATVLDAAPIVKASYSAGLHIEGNYVTVNGAQNVTGGIGGVGGIPCPASMTNSATVSTACENRFALAFKALAKGVVTMNGNTVRISGDMPLHPTQSTSSTNAVAASVAGIYVPASLQINAESLFAVSNNDVIISLVTFPGTTAWFAATEDFRRRNTRAAPLNAFTDYLHSAYTAAITIGPSGTLQGTNASLSILLNKLRFASNGFGATTADGGAPFVRIMASPGTSGSAATAFRIAGLEESSIVFGANTPLNDNAPSSTSQGTARTPLLLASAVRVAGSSTAARLFACFDETDQTSYFGIPPTTLVVEGSSRTQTYPSITLNSNGDSAASTPTVVVGPEYCGVPYVAPTTTATAGSTTTTTTATSTTASPLSPDVGFVGEGTGNSTGSGETSSDHESRTRKLVRAAIATCVTALLFVGSFFGAPVVEVQCVIAMFLSTCASTSNNDAMDVARHFLSPLQSVGSVESIGFNIGLMYGVLLIWTVVVIVFSTCMGNRTLREAAHLLVYPGGPLIIGRIFLPGIWFNVFREIHGNAGAMWGGIIAALLWLVINMVIVCCSFDLYYTDETDMWFVFPNTTTNVARSYFHVVGRAGHKLVLLWWLILPIVVCGIVSPTSVQYGTRCNVPWGFLVAIWWLTGILFAVFRPHGSLVRSAIYVGIYLVCGIITLVILVDDSTAQVVFSFFLLALVILLLIHSVFLWMYTFCVRDGAEKTVDDRFLPGAFMSQIRCGGDDDDLRTPKFHNSTNGGGETVNSPDCHNDNPANMRTMEQQIEADRARERAATKDINEPNYSNNPYNQNHNDQQVGGKKGDISASMNYGYNKSMNDGSAFDQRRETADEKLAREYREMLSATAKGYPAEEKPKEQTPSSPKKEVAFAPSTKNESTFAATATATASSPSRAGAAAPSAGSSRDADLEDIDPREKRRLQMERDMEEYYSYSKKE